MYCSHCGEELTPNYRFCPSCGTKIDESTVIAPEPPVHQVVQKKPMPIWFKIAAFVAVLALIGVTAGILFTESLVDVVDNQLSALRENDISKAYYNYTSKDFQAATSLDQFRSFIDAYPVFLNNDSAHFSQRTIEHNIGILKGTLTSQDKVNTPIEYKLIKDDGKWRILSIRLLKPRKIENAKEPDAAKNLIEVAKSQLKSIQDQKFAEAYDQYSSKEFKEATSEEAFTKFVKRYPILSDYHVVSFHKPLIRNGVGTLSVILQSDKAAAYAKYYFIQSDQMWKIWSMRILSPSIGAPQKSGEINGEASSEPQLQTEQMSISSISLGDEVDEKGQIMNPTKSFTSELQDLYVDIKITHGRKGNMIYLDLKHLESGSSIPAKAALEENGDTMLMSVFSPPASGWPVGNYQLTVTAASGIDEVVDFEVQ